MNSQERPTHRTDEGKESGVTGRPPAGGKYQPSEPGHVRIVLEFRGESARVLSADYVDRPYVEPRRPVGSWVFEIRRGERLIAVNTAPDPLLAVGIGRPDDVEHSYMREPVGTAVVAVPVSSVSELASLRIDVHEAQAALPASAELLRQQLHRPELPMRKVYSVDLASFAGGAEVT